MDWLTSCGIGTVVGLMGILAYRVRQGFRSVKGHLQALYERDQLLARKLKELTDRSNAA